MQATGSSTSGTPYGGGLDAEARRWARVLAAYRDPRPTRSLAELAVTVIPFVVLWFTMLASLEYSYWLTLLLAVPTAGFLVRLFIIQHDCGHGAFLRRRRRNDWLGRLLGVLTLTPYDNWRHCHALHHAGSGNLGKRDLGEITTLTVDEYRAHGRWGRFRYRLYRHPLVLFGLGPLYVFAVENRVPAGRLRAGWRPWVETMATNAGVAGLSAGAIVAFGWWSLLLVHVPVVILAATAGVWLFYVQHQFELTAWEAPDDWRHPVAALHGSSHYDLPMVLRWFTANIGVHHVHHLVSRIPFYRLPEVLRDHPGLRDIGRLTLRESLACVHLTLWDPRARRLVSFREAAKTLRPPEGAPFR